MLVCPSCGCKRPIDKMTIDKVFSSTEETNDSDKWPERMSSLTDIQSLLTEPGNAVRDKAWRIRCEDCDPERGGYYWLSLNQCDTPAKALDCIMQLNEKRWSPSVLPSFVDLMECLFGRGAVTAE